MKLGSQTGSVTNHLYSRMILGAPEPTIGMAATILGWTDRNPGTVIGWDGKVVSVQEDSAKRTDSNGFSESQSYDYTPNPQGSITNFRLDPRGWREVTMSTSGRWKLEQGGGQGLILGRREKYRDPSF